MAQPVSSSAVRVREFPGLFSNRGPDAPRELPGAARDQTNLAVQRAGELQARPGLRPVLYDSED